MSDKLRIFLILLAIKFGRPLIDTKDNLLAIREDYCSEYCGTECSVLPSDKVNQKYCSQTKYNVTTDKYTIAVQYGLVNVSWHANSIDFGAFKKLFSLTNINKNRVQNLIINCNYNKLYSKTNFLKSLGIDQVDKYTFKVNQQIMVITNNLNLILSSSENMSTSLWNDFIEQSDEKYNAIMFNGYKIKSQYAVSGDMFANQTQLETLEFSDVTINLSEATFKNLPTLKNLYFFNANVSDFTFLRSPVLQNNLLTIFMPKQWTELEYFKDYSKLQMIKLIDHIFNAKSYQSKAIICHFLILREFENPSWHCVFTSDDKNRKCPEGCQCAFEYITKTLNIDCKSKGLTVFPDFPIPRIGSVSLDFKNNKLSALRNVEEGYENVRELNLANNRIKVLKVEQLPSELYLLDIRNNSINSLDSEVAQLFLRRGDKLRLRQDKIRWRSNCENKPFVRYLRELQTRDHVSYDELEGLCPEKCLCCYDHTINHFIFDCRNLSQSRLPKLPERIKGDAALWLDYNKIEQLSSLRKPELKRLHLSHNNIENLQIRNLPVNMTFLDISNNELKELDNDLLDFLVGREFEISGNPWQCNCKYTKFLKYLKQHRETEYQAALRNCVGEENACHDSCFCCMEEDTKLFKIDCENKKFYEIPHLPLKAYTKLVFNRNNLTFLNSSIPGFNQIRELHLRFNQIVNIERIPNNLVYLDIRNNSMTLMSDYLVNSLSRPSVTSLYLSGNKWNCECEQLVFLRFTKDKSSKIEDLCDAECSNFKMLVKVEEKDVCSKGIPLYVFIFITLLILFAFLNWLQLFWKSISMWLYENNWLASRKIDDNKRYDCFLAYCHKDSDFLQEFVDKLENEPSSLRLCYYARDWLPGEPIPACICKSVEDSKRIIILMTNNFLKSVWGRLEFRMSLHATAKDKCKRLIVVVYPDVDNFDDLDSELKTYMKLNTYLKRDDANFWDKLILAMPCENPVAKDTESTVNTNVNGVVEIELRQY